MYRILDRLLSFVLVCCVVMSSAEKHPHMRSRCISGEKDAPKFKLYFEFLGQRRAELWTQSEACYGCPLVKICDLPKPHSQLLVNTSFPTRLELRSPEYGEKLCEVAEHFGERGIYRLSLGSDGRCLVKQLSAPILTSLPVIILVAFLSVLTVLYCSSIFTYRQLKRRRDYISLAGGEAAEGGEQSVTEDEELGETRPDSPSKSKRERLKFLDVFRGLTICLMIFVNYGGGQYWWLTHSSWNGLLLADVVFPWFMFIMGTSMALSFEGLALRRASKRDMLVKIVRRSVILFVLGVFVVNNGANGHGWASVRVMGVLQRFAVAYVVVAGLRALTLQPAASVRQRQSEKRSAVCRGALSCRKRARWRRVVWATAAALQASGYWRHLRDVWQYWIDWLVMIALTAAWLALTFLLPVDGCPTGYLGAGGLSDGARFPNCTGGAAALIDRTLLGDRHVYHHPTTIWLYNTSVPFDPEGLLGSLMSILAVFLGLQAGQILLVYERPTARIGRFLAWSALCGLSAGILCGFSQNDGWIPVNKNLWSLSFVLAVASSANAAIAVLYFLTDVRRCWFGEPFYFVGMNPLLIYLCHEVFAEYLPVQWKVADSHAAHLLVNCWGVVFWTVVAYVLHIKRFYFVI